MEAKASEPDFWNDMENSSKVLQKTKALKDKVERFEALASAREDLLVLIEMAEEENDPSYAGEVKTGYEKLTADIADMKLETLLSGQYDKNNAIITLHAGAGGTEAHDWVEMLYRMYVR